MIDLSVYVGDEFGRAAWRSDIVRRKTSEDRGATESTEARCAPTGGADTPDAMRPRARGHLWADLMRRTFGFDVLACPLCGGRLRLVALIEEAAVIGADPPASRPAYGDPRTRMPRGRRRCRSPLAHVPRATPIALNPARHRDATGRHAGGVPVHVGVPWRKTGRALNNGWNALIIRAVTVRAALIRAVSWGPGGPERRAPVSPALLVLGDMSVQGNIKPLRSLAEPLQVARDNGAKRGLIPIENKRSFLDVSADIMEHVDPIFTAIPRLRR